MRRVLFLLLVVVLAAASTVSGFAQSPIPLRPMSDTRYVDVAPAIVPGYTYTLRVFDSCNPEIFELTLPTKPYVVPAATKQGDIVRVPLDPDKPALRKNDFICVKETFTQVGSSPAMGPAKSSLTKVESPRVGGRRDCESDYSDCDWGYTVAGGVEQTDLSAQDSQTGGFVQLYVRGPLASSWGNLWLLARFLGAPNAGDTKNVIGAGLSSDGTSITANSLNSVGYAVDYVLGYEKDFRRGRRYTIGPIFGFGATTPLSAQSATAAYAMPARYTNECSGLHARFTAANGYKNPLPGDGTVTTTSTPAGGSPTTAPPVDYCSVQPFSTTTTSTTNGVTSTVKTDNTPITTLAFVPEDRSSFLLKYVVGIRMIERTPMVLGGGCRTSDSSSTLQDNCARSIVDFSIGQDQEFTGGQLHNFVFKASAIYQIPRTQMYVFLTAANRLKKNNFSDPLVLTPQQFYTGSGTPPPGAVTIPSPNVLQLPFKQPDRDFYRIGIAFDLGKLLPNFFQPSGKAKKDPDGNASGTPAAPAAVAPAANPPGTPAATPAKAVVD